ncbi:hypothetical protein [Sphingomonas sp. Leaf343]|uniref:hypothetical protein n=1 Tax=Sphingomonas sp. Leaf343 TaxID=1736345 RepID=UPI001F26DC27|nr:hypothetical protein [Sphingomonas sp. Leaf343]
MSSLDKGDAESTVETPLAKNLGVARLADVAAPRRPLTSLRYREFGSFFPVPIVDRQSLAVVSRK